MNTRNSLKDAINASQLNRLPQVVSLDAAGRQVMSTVITLGDHKFITGLEPLYFDTETNGTGTVAHNASKNSALLTGAAASDYAIIQSKRFYPYFAGKPQQPEFTFINFQPEDGCIKRIGYYSTATSGSYDTVWDGMYLESGNGVVKLCIAKEGTVTTINEGLWNGNREPIIDWSSFQVCLFDFLYLGGAIFNFYMYINGVKTLKHQHFHANKFADVIMGRPSQPVRAEVRGTGSMHFVCTQVSSMGAITQLIGHPVSIGTTTTLSAGTAATNYIALAVRRTDRYMTLITKNIEVVSNSGANESFSWRLWLGGTPSGSLSFNPVTNSKIEYALGNGTLTLSGGYRLASGVGTSRSSGSSDSDLYTLSAGSLIDGTEEILYLTYLPHQNNQSYSAIMDFLEF